MTNFIGESRICFILHFSLLLCARASGEEEGGGVKGDNLKEKFLQPFYVIRRNLFNRVLLLEKYINMKYLAISTLVCENVFTIRDTAFFYLKFK